MNSYEDAAHPLVNNMGTAVHPTCTKCGKEISGDAYHIGGGVFHVWCHPALPEMACPNCASLRAEVERLTREHEETLAVVRATISRLMDEREAAESALAAAQKRVGDARDALDEAECQCPDYTPFGPECGVCKARDALAGKEPGNGS